MSHPIRPTLTEGTNSYVTKSNAEIYFSNRFQHASWDSLSAEDRYRVLITASTQISQTVKTEYKLPFTPAAEQGLQDATCELALAMSSDAAVISQGNTSKNIKRVKAGSAEVQFFSSGSGTSNGARFPPIVMNILKSGGFISSSTISSPVASGTGCPSHFDDADTYSRVEPFA